MAEVEERLQAPPKTKKSVRPKERTEATTGPAVKKERFYARLTPTQKDLLQRAAYLSGRSLSDFIVSIATERAEAVIREREIISLSVRNSQFFAELMLNPPAPNEALRKAVERSAGPHDR